MSYAPTEVLTVYLDTGPRRKVGRLAVRNRQILFEYDPLFLEIVRNSVESQRLSTLISYATADPLAIGFLDTALAMEESSNGIWRNPITFRNWRSATSRPEPTQRSI